MFELYAITDRKMLGNTSEVDAARLCYEGGADVVQLRMKDADGGEMLEVAKEMEALANEYNRFFIVNDRVDIAMLAHADGVHLGQTDIPLREARRLVGDDMIIGVTAKTVEQALAAQRAGADYLGSGAVFGSTTKANARPLSREALREICKAVSIPVVAIGGINLQNIRELEHTNIHGVAVVSGIFSAEDIEQEARLLRDASEWIVRGDLT